jgi:ribosomal protein L35AE/L33A
MLLKVLHNDELDDLYFPTCVIWAIKSRRMCWMGHVARMVGRRGAYRVLVGRLEGKKSL